MHWNADANELDVDFVIHGEGPASMWASSVKAGDTAVISGQPGGGVWVCTRDEGHRRLALELGAEWAGDADEPPPVELDAALLFAPAGRLVPPALRALRPGGTLACAGIYMSEIPRIDYGRELFEERTLTSVTANTRRDGEELLEVAAAVPIRPRTTSFALEQANEALARLKHEAIEGSGVLEIA